MHLDSIVTVCSGWLWFKLLGVHCWVLIKINKGLIHAECSTLLGQGLVFSWVRSPDVTTYQASVHSLLSVWMKRWNLCRRDLTRVQDCKKIQAASSDSGISRVLDGKRDLTCATQ